MYMKLYHHTISSCLYLWERVRVFAADSNSAPGVQQHEVGQHEEVCVGDGSLELERLHQLDDGGAREELLVALLDEAAVAVVAQGHQLREVDVGTVLEEIVCKHLRRKRT